MTECQFPECVKPARGRGYCVGHYKQLRVGQPLKPLAVYGSNKGKTCSGPKCERPAESRGMCSTHASQVQRGTELTVIGERRPGPNRLYAGVSCSFDGCDRNATALGLCNAHHAQHRRDIELHPLGWRPPKVVVPCEREDCERPAARMGLCSPHYRQSLRGMPRVRKNHNGRRVDANGYVYVKRPGNPEARKAAGWGAEHRIVLADHLGRALYPDESGHHKNGDRQDNRLSNLELWSRWQPCGQRVEDKVAYAKELLARYEPGALVPQRLDPR